MSCTRLTLPAYFEVQYRCYFPDSARTLFGATYSELVCNFFFSRQGVKGQGLGGIRRGANRSRPFFSREKADLLES